MLKKIINTEKSILEYVSDQGLAWSCQGGTRSTQFAGETVKKISKQNAVLELSGDRKILIYSPSTFLKTLKKVEKKFGYRLFE